MYHNMKNVYTLEEVNQLKAWFDQVELPAEMQLDKAVYIPDVKETVARDDSRGP